MKVVALLFLLMDLDAPRACNLDFFRGVIMQVLLCMATSFQLASTFTVGPAVATRPNMRSVGLAMAEFETVDMTTIGMTVAEAKEGFQASFGARVLSMPLQAFISEMLQSTTFAMAAKTYRYTPVMALGFVRLW